MIRFACSTITFRSSPVAAALAEIAAAGFTDVDLAVIPGFCPHFDAASATPAERAAFVARMRASGLRFPTLTCVPGQFNAPDADTDRILSAARANLELAAELGIPAVNVNCGLPVADRAQHTEHALRAARGLKATAREAAALGLRINVEAPHRNGLSRTLDEAEFLMSHIDEPNAAYLLDVTHVQAGGSHPGEAVERFAGRIGHVHLRDGKGENIFLTPGEGDIDFRSFFAALERSGYTGYCAFELEGRGESLEERRADLRRAKAYVLPLAGRADA